MDSEALGGDRPLHAKVQLLGRAPNLESFMQFEIPRSTATFAVFHPREEKNKGMACDIPFRITIDGRFLPMLAPPQLAAGETENPDQFVNEFWTVEGYVRRPHLSPLKVHRKPEGVAVTIYDDSKKGPLKLDGCTLNKLEVELRSPHQIVLAGQIQYAKYNDKELVRINALSNKTHDISISIPQTDLFDAPEQKAAADDASDEGTQSEDDDNVVDLATERASRSEADDDEREPEEQLGE